MTLKKITQPCEILFRFDHERPGVLKGAHYCDRTVVLDDGVVISSVQNPAVAVNVGAGTPGLVLADILGTLVLGQQAQLDEQAAAIEAHNNVVREKDAELVAKDANAQALLARVAELEDEIATGDLGKMAADLAAKDATAQALLAQVADLEAALAAKG